MTTLTAPLDDPIVTGHSRPSPAPPVAGAAYVAAWLVGLLAFPLGPAIDAPAAEVGRFYTEHALGSTVQAVLVHGVAAAALLAVLVAVRARGASTSVAHGAGLTGVGLSLAQLVLEVWRGAWAGDHPAPTVDRLFDAVNRIDGLKMLAFAVMIGAGIAAARRAGLVGRRMAVTGTVATVALVASGTGYLAGAPALGAAAFVSLPLLLAWVATLGVAAGRAPR